MDDDELIHALKRATKRAREAPATEPANAREVDAIADAVVHSYPPARARGRARGRVSMLVAGSAGIALAAGALLLARSPAAEDLPGYEVATFGGARNFRGAGDGEATEAPHVRRGDRFQVAIQPEGPVKGPLAARAVLVRGSEVIPFRGSVELGAAGAARISAGIDDFRGASPGHWEVVLIVARPDAIGEADTVPREGPKCRVRRVAIDVE
jgi:hypothetical protein